MKCKECINEGKKSRVFPGFSSTTLMYLLRSMMRMASIITMIRIRQLQHIVAAKGTNGQTAIKGNAEVAIGDTINE